MTIDTPYMHEDGFVPMLDLKVNIRNNKISHRFYKKSCAHKLTILERSAVPMSIKRNTIFQESMRRIKNHSLDNDWSTIADELSVFSNTLRLSGYNKLFRYNVLKGVKK